MVKIFSGTILIFIVEIVILLSSYFENLISLAIHSPVSVLIIYGWFVGFILVAIGGRDKLNSEIERYRDSDDVIVEFKPKLYFLSFAIEVAVVLFFGTLFWLKIYDIEIDFIVHVIFPLLILLIPSLISVALGIKLYGNFGDNQMKISSLYRNIFILFIVVFVLFKAVTSLGILVLPLLFFVVFSYNLYHFFIEIYFYFYFKDLAQVR